MYSIIFNKKEIELPNYSFQIAESLETTETINGSGKSYKEKCKALYKFETELLGEEIVKEIIGDFEKCDPNDIQLLYMGIVDCYNQPIIEKRNEQLKNTLSNYEIDKISKVIDTAEKIK